MITIGGSAQRWNLIQRKPQDEDDDDEIDVFAEEEDDDGGVAAMDQSKDVVIPTEWPPLELPVVLQVSPDVVEVGDGGFRYRWQTLPPNMPGFPSHLMKSMAASTEISNALRGDFKTMMYLQPILPVPVHASPLAALFASHFIAPSDSKRDLKIQPRAWNLSYTSCVESACRLMELRDLALKGNAIEISMEPGDLRILTAECAWRQQERDRKLNDDLDALYTAVAYQNESYEESIFKFTQLMEEHALSIINMYEYEIWRMLLEPYEGAPALTQVLTPRVMPNNLVGMARGSIILIQHDVVEFFRFKRDVRRDTESSDPHVPWRLDVESIPAWGQTDANGGYRGCIPRQIIQQYFHYMDEEGKVPLIHQNSH